MQRRVPRVLRGVSLGAVRVSLRGGAFFVAALFCFVVAYAAALPVLLYVGAFLAALPAAAVLSVWARRPRLAVVRTFQPQVIPVGSTATVSLVVHNRGTRRSARAIWRDRLPWQPGFTPDAELRTLPPRGARVAARTTATVSYELRPPRRGVFPVGPLRVELRDAFGLASSSSQIGDEQDVTVTPPVIPLAEAGLSVPAGDGESRLVQRRATGDDDDAMTREYRTGDALRRVHWRASARHGDLMVRQEEQRSLPEARLIVDTRLAGYPEVSDDPDDVESAAFEWVVRMLASVAVHLRRVGFIITIDETAAPQLDAPSGGHRHSWGDEEFLAGLASLGLSETAAPPAASGERGSGPVIALLGDPEPETVDWLLEQRNPGELAVAFLAHGVSAMEMIDSSFATGPTDDSALERLSDAGWLVVPVRSDDDHAAAWEAVVVETGRARGNG